MTSVVQHKFLNPQQPLLAHDKVRHVGEAIAVIVAESRDQAEDAAELVRCDFEELPAVVDPKAALAPDSPIVHDRYETNLIGAFSVGRGDADAALAAAPHRLRRSFYHHRYAAMPMECRGVVSAYDPRTDTATVWSSTQVVHWVRREAAGLLGLPEAKVRCIRPRCRRRLWRQGPRLPRRSAGSLSLAPARAAGALDREPQRAFDERDAFARPAARSRSRV
jgi:carbon-monoxide dehydrogenase large subunit